MEKADEECWCTLCNQRVCCHPEKAVGEPKVMVVLSLDVVLVKKKKRKKEMSPVMLGECCSFEILKLSCNVKICSVQVPFSSF